MFLNKLMNHKSLIYLIVIIVIATLLRIVFLDTIPNSFHCDEASNGYDAYSILETLRDRSGKFLPLFLTAFNDWRPSLYAFITVPFIKIFGVSELATRLSGAIIAVLNVAVLYYLVKEIDNKKTALIAAFLLAISPWHIIFSRISHEAILLPFLFCLGLLCFLRSLHNPNYLILSALSFGISLNTYQSARVFVPLFLVGLIFLFRQHLWKYKKHTIIAFILFLFIFIPLFQFWTSPIGMMRARIVGIENNLISLIQNYLSYFSPNFLFFNGDTNPRHSLPNLGELYYFEIITVSCGLFYLIKEYKKERSILILWLLLYPIPAALTQPTHSLRAIVGVPLFSILSAYGITYLLNLLKLKFSKKTLFIVTFLFLFTVSFSLLGKKYFIEYPLSVGEHSYGEYGIREAITYAEKSSYECIVISIDKNSAHCMAVHNFNVFVPFYSQYPPAKYQSASITNWIRVARENINTIGKYSLVPISRQSQLKNNCLYIIQPDEVESFIAKGYEWKEVLSIKDPRGVEHFKLIEII